MREDKQNFSEKAILVGIDFSRRYLTHHNGNSIPVEESLDELAELARTAGAHVVDRSISKREKPSPATFIGSGKVLELAHQIEEESIDLVIFDDDLSPGQQRQLQETFKIKVVDRTGLILDIFAQRAHSGVGKLEVELAQLLYLLPRLTHMWAHLSRQKGGIGTRGPGETQLEVDRRRVREKISRLKVDLEESRQNRATQRKKREKIPLPTVALVGYTNAGKSTLLNALAHAEVLVDDKLFATLDPTSRKVILPNKQAVVFTDTVGFIRKLPHHLVESFKATLEEVGVADILLHVLDISHPQADEHFKSVLDVLKDLKCNDKPTILALNKIDQLGGHIPLLYWEKMVKETVAISGKEKLGFDSLFHKIEHLLASARQTIELKIPLSRGDLISQIYRQGQVLKTNYTDDSVSLTATIPQAFATKLAEFVLE